MPKATILIVDDEEELRDNLQDLLEFWDYEVIAVGSGEAAVEKASVMQFDAALLDIQLPGMDGLETLKKLKAAQSDLPVAMVSASSVRGVLAKADEYGAVMTILKPYSPQEMREAVQTLLAKSRKTEG
ncbi:MAG: response regulator [Candidatus Omnitrophica bacterium]|nr:response regulator [Candidatus Omnitrophota bacterium]